MKYHINNKHEVKPCKADVQKCRFADSTQNQGHFTNADEANEAAHERLQKEFSLIPSVSKVKKHSSVLSKFANVSRSGVHVKLEHEPRKSSRTESTVTIIDTTPQADSKLLDNIRNGRERAFVV